MLILGLQIKFYWINLQGYAKTNVWVLYMQIAQDFSWKNLELDSFHNVSMTFIPTDSETEKEKLVDSNHKDQKYY